MSSFKGDIGGHRGDDVGFPKSRDTILGVPRIWETTIYACVYTYK